MVEAKKEAHRLNISYPTSDLKAVMDLWLKARTKVSALLAPSAQSAYNQPTSLMVHSLIYTFFY
ncbi:hypothetical protein [Prevotella veroralis]|uniref:Uncharacterized protein n=1 Tax=Prevotella veroralis F0319 TaxID=649761 RepID=C9MLM9_9BACT|nr:hypothetical protein [Prevotella veroralis]EEX19563.1 hypothetical protein HMPREF0973_00504 [Prevotella veroralis F0319]QUB41793.1 hypothetical protein J5A55_11645 [Prevotella veroralis]